MNAALRWKLLAGFALVFVAGGLTGGFIGALHARQMFIGMHENMLAERMRHRLRAELQLTSEQEAKIAPIIDKAAAHLRQIRHSTGQQVHETLMQAHREIRPVLNDEQRVKLTRFEEYPRHWRWFSRHGSPHSPQESASPTAP